MSTIGKMAAGVLYKTALKHFPEAASLPEGEGALLQFETGAEIHLNVQSQSPGRTQALLAFFSKAKGELEEEACFEVNFDHAAKTLQAETVRGDTEKPLASRLSATARSRLQGKSVISRAGSGTSGEQLYAQIFAFAPEVEGLSHDQTSAKRGKAGQKPKINVVQNTAAEMSLEFSDIGLKGFHSMEVAVDKTRKTASVTAVSGSFGRYPSYLAYPDGKEMLPHEREKFSQMLMGRLGAAQAQRTISAVSRLA